MNKNTIQKFAVWARSELIAQVTQRAYQYGIDEKGYGEENAAVVNGRVLTIDERRQRDGFIVQIKHKGFKQIVEEVAYTWFNRFAALRFMEVNNFLPSHIRVFSDADGSFAPEILKDALHLDLPGLDKDKVAKLLNDNAADGLYRYLLLTQCNALSAALPEMFEKMGAYTEMLLPINILRNDGILARMVRDIPEDDWHDAVQIVGWLYQYYNTELKQEVFDGLKKNVKVTKEKIPAATQLFTPDWIVRYMVENSLGRLWLDGHPNDALKSNWKYYLDEAEQEAEVFSQLEKVRQEYKGLKPEDIKVIDPCMGSGHILVYAFDVFMKIYESAGYSQRDAARLILEKNLYGLDIDRRAYQLAYFALIMKARSYNRRALDGSFAPQVYHPEGWRDGEEFGSLLKIDALDEMPHKSEGQTELFDTPYETDLRVWNFKRLLSQKYDIVVTNPPYMGGSGMGTKLSEFVKKEYPDSKSDLFAVFIERGLQMIKLSGFNCMVTMQSWMFLSSFETMRKKILSQKTIVNLIHMENMVMGIAFGTAVANIMGVHIASYKGKYNHVELSDIVDGKPDVFPPIGKRNTTATTDNFEKIPGSPVAYWVGEKFMDCYNYPLIRSIAFSDGQILTGNNEKYLRNIWEVDSSRIAPDKEWVLHAKGGEYRRWSGNIDVLVSWSESSRHHYIHDKISRFPKENILFRRGVTWSLVSSGNNFGVRELTNAQTFNKAAAAILFEDEQYINYILGFLNTVIAQAFLHAINPTINNNISDILNMPLKIEADRIFEIDTLVGSCIVMSRSDWDCFETSWDFKRHPLV